MARSLVSATLLISFLLLVGNFALISGATETDTSYPKSVDFENTDGTNFVEILTLNGSMNFDGYNHSWEIFDLFDLGSSDEPELLLSGQYLDSIVPTNEGIWEWNLDVNISGLNCTCSVVVSSSSNGTMGQEEAYSSSLIVYLGESGHHPYILYESISNLKIDQTNYLVTFTVITPQEALDELTISTNQGFILDSNYCQAPSNVCLDNTMIANLNYTYIGDKLTISIDQDALVMNDGFWMFDFSLKDQFLRESNTVYSTLVLDDTPPSVSLTINSDIQESESFLVYAYVDDFFIGSQLSLTWTITDPSGNSRGLLEQEAYHNSTIELVLDESGYWDIQILVRDSANFIVVENLTVRVENIIPIIDLDLNGLSVSQGDELFVTGGSPWSLNASDSFDTINDIGKLNFEWYMDGVKLETSSHTLSNNDIQIEGTSEISLVISDDDSASDSLSFTLSVNQVNQDQSSSQTIIIVGSGFFVIALAVGLIVYSRRDKSTIEVHKWNSKN